MADDLFDKLPAGGGDYDASSIEVLEGLEPVRRRPGMYIGGIDERALHHLAAEVLDNAMDEAVAGHANRIEVVLDEGNRLTISDNGRGMPVDEHPKFPGKSSVEVILTTLHSGGKFSGKAYATSGGLHGVGVSVVNALSEHTRVEVARNRELYAQEFSRGHATGGLQHLGGTPNRRGTTVSFTPDPEIFGDREFKPARLFKLGVHRMSAPCNALWTALVTPKKSSLPLITCQSASMPTLRSSGTWVASSSATPPPYGVALRCSTRAPWSGFASPRMWSMTSSPTTAA